MRTTSGRPLLFFIAAGLFALAAVVHPHTSVSLALGVVFFIFGVAAVVAKGR